MDAPDSVLSPYTASDGENIAVQDWPLARGAALRGVVVLVHGLGEHAGRYDRLAAQLNRWGFAVRGYDQYGHGESGGGRGALPTALRLQEDLADVIESTRQRMDGGLPLIVLGHSLGGLVAASLVARHGTAIEGLVLSSPLLGLRLGIVQKLLLAVLPRVAPNLTVRNGLDPDDLSHDAGVVAAYRADPLVHDRVSGRLAAFMAAGGEAVIERAGEWRVPTLLLYAGADRIVDPAATRRFAEAAPRAVVTTHCFDGLAHEVFNELDPQPVLARLGEWLDRHFGASAPATPGRRR